MATKVISFLREAKTKVDELIETSGDGNLTLVHIVIGNEAADLDSTVASIVYAFHLHTKAGTKAKDCQAEIFLPIINIPKEDFALRTEITAVFERIDFPATEDLIFRESFHSLAKVTKYLDIVLVDHNALPSESNSLHPFVTGIIDHHHDSGTFHDPYIVKKIESVGSCCTLIAENIYNQNEELFKEYPVAELLLSAILLDTVNLAADCGRTSAKDVEFAEELEELSRIPRSELFEIAQKAKFDISRLSCYDMLRKDFKMVPGSSGSSSIAISSITLSLSEFIEKEQWLEDAASFLQNNEYQLIILMFIHKEATSTKREILIYSVNVELRENLCEYLLGIAELQLTKFDIQLSVSSVQMFYQGHVKISRKFLMPYVSKFYENFLEDSHESAWLTSCHSEESKTVPRQMQTQSERGDIFTAGSSDQLLQTSPYSNRVYPDAKRIGNHSDEMESGISHESTNPKTKCLSSHKSKLINPTEVQISDLFKGNKSQPDCILNGNSNSQASVTLGEENHDKLNKHEMSNYVEKPFNKKESSCFKDLGMEADMLYERSPPLVVQGPSDLPLGSETDQAYLQGELNYSPLFSPDKSFESSKGVDQPTLEFEDEWHSQLYDMKSSKKTSTGSEQKHQILIRDLSFDESNTLPDLFGMDLLCPVFLAVTEDDEDDDVILKDIRRKTKSIENLCSIIPADEEFPLRRTKSELPVIRRKASKQLKTVESAMNGLEKTNDFAKRHDSIQEEASYEENPLAGDGEFSDEEAEDYICGSTDGELSISKDSADWKAELNSMASFSDPLRMQKSREKTVERFSFSDESLEMYEAHENGCDCYQCQKASISTNGSLNNHVPGLWERFITVNVGNTLRVVDLQLIEPYMKVISHGGFYKFGNEKRIVMVFTAAYLPQKFIPKYQIVMEQLFYYVVHTLDLSVIDSYDIVYFNGSGPNMPGRDWLKKCYNMVARRLKKNLQALYLVHPNFLLKAMVRFYRPFISSKFFKKIHFIKSLKALSQHISLEYIFLPEEVKGADPECVYWLRS